MLRNLLFFIIILIINIFSQQCPRFDITKTYTISECAYFESPNGGRNYFSEHNSNRGNPPFISTWWWDECLNNDANCKSQFIDNDGTCKDTVIVLDTTNIIILDTSIFIDTIQFNDTTKVIINDTNDITVFDTNYVFVTDTNILTIEDTLIIPDTVIFNDTNVITNIVNIFDTVIFNDTISVVIINKMKNSHLYNQVEKEKIWFRNKTNKESRKEVNKVYKTDYDTLSVLDTITYIGLNNLRVIMPEGMVNEDVFIGVQIDLKGIKEGDNIVIELQGYVYDQLGQYVKKVNKKQTIIHESLYVQDLVKFKLIESRNGFLIDGYNRKLGIGPYIIQAQVRVYVNNKIEDSASDLSTVGYTKRD